MCSTAFAHSDYDFEDTEDVGQMWRMEISNVSYKINPQSKAVIVQQNGVEWIKFIEAGDVEIIAYDLDEDYSYRALIHIVPSETNYTNYTNDTDMYMQSEKAPSEAAQAGFAERVLELVNVERTRAGLRPLTLSGELMDACKIRAWDLTKRYAHTRPNGKSFNTLVKDGRYTAGENIAAGVDTAEAVVKMWMDSSGHRANILKRDYTELGVGYAYAADSPYKHYWVQIFKRPMPRPGRW